MTIYGECIGTRERLPVTISALCGQECELQAEREACALEGPLDLWIGAIGPLPVFAEVSGSGRSRAKFQEPLDERIIAHFGEA